jgi:hypothetical protein
MMILYSIILTTAIYLIPISLLIMWNNEDPRP